MYVKLLSLIKIKIKMRIFLNKKIYFLCHWIKFNMFRGVIISKKLVKCTNFIGIIYLVSSHLALLLETNLYDNLIELV